MEAVNKVKDLLYNLVLDYQDSMEDVATTHSAETRPSAPTQMDGSQFIFVGALMTCLDEKDEEMGEDDSTIIDE
ncbi:hypothetical protein C2845_PM06G28830 [Panicum miliaceum]|uniref:Uncharacterized protein n=1 Tax=Panicum miliaceum TaxID=4540 RepID=A0A3L6RCE6_PANMI|nr:hypothetical protein C2845_PM06G28830 [Panicum miliaceum]